MVSATLKESWRKETVKAILQGIQQDVETVQTKEKDYVELLRAPYVKGFSEGLQRKL